jgi:cysteine synthase
MSVVASLTAPAAASRPAPFDALGRMIGNTPLLAISYRSRAFEGTVYAKCEHLNLTGSIKDRMALHILSSAYRDGTLRPGGRIVEATSGNTGISFSALGRSLGHPVTIFMPDWMSAERKQLIASYGAEIVGVSREQGGFIGSIRLAEELSAGEPGSFLPRQFSNQANVDAHAATTGPEIWLQLAEAGLSPDAFVAGVGTGGTVMGVGRYLRERNPAVRIHPVEPAESPTLSSGRKIGRHRIQGISDEFIPPIVDLARLDAILSIRDGDSILMAQKLACCLGLGVGISSGCNFLAAVLLQEELGAGAVVVTVFADDNKKYLSTDLMREEPIQRGYLAPGVELTGIRTLPRHCAMCDAR